MRNDRIDYLCKKSVGIPLTPGVYIMKNRKGEIIYIGKAKKLKNRVSQYFLRFESHTGKTRKMVENVYDFEYILTTSEVEALTLECSMIKQHMPKYNILLKDDKGFCFIRLSDEQYPRLSVVYKKENDGATYFGPFLSAGAAKETVELARKMFLIPACSVKLDYKKRNEARPCLNYHIKQCCAPCTGRVSPDMYAESVKSALSFINGGMKKTMDELVNQMNTYSNALEYEKAAQVRDRINAINRIWQRQGAVSDEYPEHDVFAVSTDGVTLCICVMNIREGRVKLKENFFFDADTVEDIEELMIEFICEYYNEREIPNTVVVCSQIDEYELLREWFISKRMRRFSLRCIGHGSLPKTAKICSENADEALAQYSVSRVSKSNKASEELRQLIGLKKEINRIEAYDISHTGGKNTVGGMVVFENCSPKKSDYKRYKISVDGADDYSSMCEMISRRIKRLGEEGFSAPDIILLDGGSTHVAVIKKMFDEIGVDIPLFGMVKDDRHSLRTLVSPSGEINISPNSRVFKLLYSISEEVHRYAITYHTKIRNKEVVFSELLVIDGIGKTRARSLLKHFGNINTIKEATVDELVKVKGMNIVAANRVFEYYHN